MSVINSNKGTEVMTEHVNINGYPHKIGNKGFVYMRVNGDWMRSTKSKDEVQRSLKKRLVSAE